MNEEIFRKKSLERVKSPESLDDYIRVANPGVWLLMISVIVLLVGACVWGVFGHIDSTVTTAVRVENGSAACYIADDDISSVKVGSNVKFGDFEAVITEIAEKADLGYVGTLYLTGTVPDGFYEGKIVVESVKPLSFVFN